MIVNIDKNPYQINHFFVGSIMNEGVEYPFTLEIIDVTGADEDQDSNINWQHFPPDIEECERLILEQYKEQITYVSQ